MNKYLFFALLLIVSTNVSSNTKCYLSSDDDTIYEKVEQQPSYPGGQEGLRDYINKNIVYPKLAEKNDVKGYVNIKFVVEKNGDVSNVVAESSSVTTYGHNQNDNKSKSYNELFVKTVKDAIQKMAKWTPATVGGSPVRCQMRMKIVFGLDRKDVFPTQIAMCFFVRGKNALENVYAKDKKLNKDTHLYLVDDKYYVSGINKEIHSLSDEDLLNIDKKAKTLGNDILCMLEKNSDYFDLTDGKKCPGVTRPLMNYTLNGLDEYMKENLTIAFETLLVKVSFFVEADGTISCPVVEKGDDIKANKEIIHLLRKTKNWYPAQKDGVSVRSRISHVFSYKQVVTRVPAANPSYSNRGRRW